MPITDGRRALTTKAIEARKKTPSPRRPGDSYANLIFSKKTPLSTHIRDMDEIQELNPPRFSEKNKTRRSKSILKNVCCSQKSLERFRPFARCFISLRDRLRGRCCREVVHSALNPLRDSLTFDMYHAWPVARRTDTRCRARLLRIRAASISVVIVSTRAFAERRL